MEVKREKVVPISQVDDFDDYDEDTLFILDDQPLHDPRTKTKEKADN